MRNAWRTHPTPLELVPAIARDTVLWETDLSVVPGFVAAVTEALELLIAEGVGAALDEHLAAADAVVS